MGICKMYKKIQQMNSEYIKNNNSYEIEFSNARGVVNYLHYHDYNNSLSLSSPSLASMSSKSNTSLLKGRMRLGGRDGASAKRLANSAAYEGSSNVLEGLKHMPRRRTAFSPGTLNPQATWLETRWHWKMGNWYECKHDKTYKANLRTKKTECAFGHLLKRIKNRGRQWGNWAGSLRRLGIAHGE